MEINCGSIWFGIRKNWFFEAFRGIAW